MTKCNNCRFRAKVDGKEVEGRISVVGDYLQFFYLYGRNESCHSMLISYYREHHGIDYFDDFEVVPRDPETYKDWQVGDSIKYSDNYSTGRIIFRSGDFVAADIEGTCNCYTCDELFNDEYRLVLTDIEQQIIEERKKYEPQDGDIVAWKDKEDNGKFAITISRGKECGYFTLFTNGTIESSYCTLDMNIVRPATDEEKQLLFDAMAKEGKRWNAEKKIVEDIPKPYEFKKGEPVLVRSDYGRDWTVAVYVERSINPDAQFGKYGVTDGRSIIFYRFCIPYNERTMHLLGTSEDYKEGE